MEKHVTVDSFGPDCPENWEEIADFLNRIIDEHEPLPDEREEYEWHCDLWETYWHGEIPGVPLPIE